MKRLNYFQDDNYDIPVEDIVIEELFDLEDIINNDETYNVLTQDHYDQYLRNVEDDIHFCYKNFKNNNICKYFLNNDEFGHDSMCLVSLIYKHIHKEYKADLFYDNLELAEPLFNTEPKNNKKKQIVNQTTIINNSKKFDWNTKKFK